MTAPFPVAVSLKPFPGMPHPPIKITVEVTRSKSGRLRLWYVVSGDIDALLIPAFGEPAREDLLWQHYCDEAFIRTEPGTAYREYNLAPSRKWAAYDFDAYRDGMRDAPVRAPEITTAAIAGMFSTGADIWFEGPAVESDWDVGLTMVIEDKDGTKSYWALAHPSPEPDFHHAGSFVLELPAADAA